MTIEREKSEIRNTLIFHLWVFYVLLCTELIQPDFTSKPCFSLKAMDQHKPQPLLFCLRTKKLETASFSAFGFPKPWQKGLGRNFSIFWSWGFGLLVLYEKFLLGPVPLCLRLFCLQIDHHPQSILSDLIKHFPSPCAYCPFIKLVSQNFDFFWNFEYFALFFILHVWFLCLFVLRNLVLCLKILSCSFAELVL